MKNKHSQLVLCFISMILCSTTTWSQLVNVERLRIKTDTTGWYGEIGLAGSFVRSEKNVTAAEANLLAEYKRKNDLLLLFSNYSFLFGDGQQLIDEFMVHCRYNIKQNKYLRWEAFVQAQQNEILNIKSRFLVGIGPRFKLFDNKKVRLYAATLAMREVEKENTDNQIVHADYRSSSYLSFTIQPFENAEIISTSYYQPLFKGIEDYRFLNQSSLVIGAGKHFKISINFYYLYDSKTAEGIVPINSKLTTGISYKL